MILQTQIFRFNFGNQCHVLHHLPTSFIYILEIIVTHFCFQVFDDIAVELTMAVLQYLGGEGRPEPLVFRCLKSLHQFCQVSGQDVPQLIQMIGPHPSKFRGQSERNDILIEEITKRIR